jgi:peptidyl-prolyl cis-trans isomerase D
LARTTRDIIRASVAVSDQELRQEYDRRQNRISLSYVRFTSSHYAEIVDPSAEEVAGYVAANKEMLQNRYEAQGARFVKLPPQVRLRFIRVERPTVPEDADAELKKTLGEQDAVARARINDARAQIVGGESFQNVAREVSQDAATARGGGDYGWVSVEGTGSGLEAVIDEAAQALEIGELSKVLPGEEAYYLVRTDGKREGDVPEADALEELAFEALRQERGKILAKQAAEEGLLAVKDGQPMSKLFAAPDALGATGPGIEALSMGSELPAPGTVVDNRPRIEETGLFARGRSIPGIGANPEVTEAAWAADPADEVIDRVFESAAGFLIAGVEDKQQGTNEGFAESRNDLFRELTERRAGPIISKFGRRRCLEARGHGDIKPNAEQIKRQISYETKKSFDESGKRVIKPYSMCDRVGNRGGMLTVSANLAGARQ